MLQVPMSRFFCWDKIVIDWLVQITKLYPVFSYNSRINAAFFWLGAAFIVFFFWIAKFNWVKINTVYWHLEL